MKQSPMNTKESNGSKKTNLELEKKQKKPSRKNTKKEYDKNQFVYEDKLHQKHKNAVHAIFASILY